MTSRYWGLMEEHLLLTSDLRNFERSGAGLMKAGPYRRTLEIRREMLGECRQRLEALREKVRNLE